VTTVEDIIGGARHEGRAILTEAESKQILREMKIPTTRIAIASSREEAVARAREIGYPVVLKVDSFDITHKSDVGGVAVNLADAEAVERAFDQIMVSVREKAPDAEVRGVSVQEMAPPGVEVIIGMSKDPQFGPVLMFGLGGIAVEILKDVAFRIVPLEPRDAAQMIREIKGFPMLTGYRNLPPVDLDFLERMVLQVSDFVWAHGEIAEMDLNPVIAHGGGALAADARVILETEPA
jgi:acyl-CoA synthetase (NDP forming)